VGIQVEELELEELLPTYFFPNFLRPIPVEEELQSEEDPFFDDLSDGIWLIPGVSPDPYWDHSMGMDFNYSKIK